MWHGFFHVFLRAVLSWKWHQIRWKSHHFLRKCPKISTNWTYPKSMSCSSMENKSKPGWITWNCHGIRYGFRPNCRWFVIWNDSEFPWEPMSHFLHGSYILWDITYFLASYAHQNPCHGQMTWNSHGIGCRFGPNSRRFVTWNTWNVQENPCHMYYRGREIWRKTHWSLAPLVTNASFVSFVLFTGNLKFFTFSRNHCVRFVNFQNLTSD